MTPTYTPLLHKTVKTLDEQLQNMLLDAYNKKPIKWKNIVHPINCLRAFISQWRGEKWIKQIWRWLHTKLEDNPQFLHQAYNKKGTTYLMFNTITKKMIIGSTGGNLYQRFAKHISGRVDNLSKKAARYVLEKGIEKWIIMPIEYSDNRQTLYKWEGIWAKRFKNYLINNPIQLNNVKPTKKRTECKRIRDKEHAIKKKELRYKWQGYLRTIDSTDHWKEWDKLAVINLLINMKMAKLPINIEREISYKLRNHLAKVHQFKLRPYYIIKVPTTKIDVRNKIKSWIKNYIKNHYTDAYSSYVANHIRISMESTIKLNKLINNSREILKKYTHGENEQTCHCHLFEELRNGNQHINIKAQDLPTSWKPIKEILITPSKTPVILPYKTYLGVGFDRMRSFLDQNQLYRKWSHKENEGLYRILYRPKPKGMHLSLDEILRKIKPLQKLLGFIPLDKNNNTWTIICKKHYIQMHLKEFTNTNYYERIYRQPKYLMNKIEQTYQEKILPELKHKIGTNKNWTLSNAYLLPKNKDQEKTRPIVSYFNHYSKRLGEKVARALTVMIKILILKWNTCEMHDLNKLHINMHLEKISKRWQDAMEKEEMTLMKFDIKSQFTNLNKDRVLKSLNFGLDTLAKTVNRTLCFCIRNRKYEKSYDHIGHPFKYKEIGLTPSLVKQYIEYELNTSYFQINGICYRQKNGLPMGGFNSAPLACLDAMAQEHICANLLKKRISIRYRDDILLIAPKKLNEAEIHKQHMILNKIYGPELTVELEGYSNKEINFLEYKLTNKLETYHHNKNYNKESNQQIIRYPSAIAEYPKHIFLGTLIGTIKRATSRASTLNFKILSCITTIIEFIQLKYDTKLIATAINYSSLPIKIIQEIRTLLRSCSLLKTLRSLKSKKIKLTKRNK